MIDSLRLYDWITFFYAVSVFLYFIDFIQPSRRANRYAFWTLAVVWGLQTIFFIERMRALNYVPVFTTFEATIFFAWLLNTFALIINYLYKMELFTFLVNIIGFAFVAFDIFARKGATQLSAPMQGDLLVIHVSMALISYAAFSLACIVSIMYLFQHYMLKLKKWTPFFRRLPALERLDNLSFQMVKLGFPTLLIAMILGAIWYRVVFGHFLWLDAKPLVSLLLLIVYGVYLYLRVVLGWAGRRLAWLNVLGFCIVIVNYVLVGKFMSNFHKWG
ncbi:cytochrome c biogenesis protein [Fodinisporobacter ferrooxydans]|uniref:Cytochrome c biogenesis protein n=1 Tax=Fodinisporobacter ferrooxydans TaxID=2901836 RepID=A0ABY4CJJ8_9BACL|nr:cytochrome c biogenesis protein [Alicyclobacillaceae bacterium MYW30-H2]